VEKTMRFATFMTSAIVIFTTPALASVLNAFRAQHKRPALSMSVRLAGIAYEQASLMAGRHQIDHKDFRKRIGPIGSTHAENVLVGCDDEACAIDLPGQAISRQTRKNPHPPLDNIPTP
jgi:hypothetical protein